MEKTGTTGMVGVEDDYPPLSDSQRKRKRSLWTKQKGLRRESYDVQSTRSDSQLTANYDRKASTCSVLDSDFIGETLCPFFDFNPFEPKSTKANLFRKIQGTIFGMLS